VQGLAASTRRQAGCGRATSRAGDATSFATPDRRAGETGAGQGPRLSVSADGSWQMVQKHHGLPRRPMSWKPRASRPPRRAPPAAICEPVTTEAVGVQQPIRIGQGGAGRRGRLHRGLSATRRELEITQKYAGLRRRSTSCRRRIPRLPYGLTRTRSPRLYPSAFRYWAGAPWTLASRRQIVVVQRFHILNMGVLGGLRKVLPRFGPGSHCPAPAGGWWGRRYSKGGEI